MDRCAVLVSFEGPDWYAWRGGLAERVAGLAAELVTRGWQAHQIYLGDPRSPGIESLSGGRLILHRWAQWLSAGFPGGVYDGEEVKAEELARSLPSYVLGQLIQPALAAGMAVMLIAEEWQTAPFVLGLGDRLRHAGLASRVPAVWRAGSTHGWERVDWERLAAAATIGATTEELCQALRSKGVPAVLLPAGPQDMLASLVPLFSPPPDRVVPVRARRRRNHKVLAR